MIPVLTRIGPIPIYSFGLVLAFTFLLCGELYRRELARRGLDPDLSGVVLTWAVVGGLLGARLYHVIENWRLFAAHPRELLSTSGLAVYGGLAGGIILSWLALARKQAPVLRASDACAPFLALGYALGRVGCFLAGDGDYGPPSDLPWAIAFPNGTVPTSERVHPTPLYETGMMLLVVAVLWRLRLRRWPDGRLFAVYLALQGVERFIAEVYRINPPVLGRLTMAQIISIGLVLGGGAWAWWLGRRAEPAGDVATAEAGAGAARS